MRKLSLIIMCSMSMYTMSQSENQSKDLTLKSFSFSPEIFVFDEYSGGFSVSGDLSFSSKKNIFTFSATVGEEYVVWGSADNFQQINLLFGREFKLIKRFFIEGHTGIGFLFYNTYNGHFSEIGVPIALKLRFKTKAKFSIGLKLQTCINSFDNIFSGGLLLQWNY